jgi:uncharacterized cupin superfamily protein
MSDRPACIVVPEHAPVFERPATDGVGFRVRALSDAGGLKQMGVKIREIDPGLAGTHLHFHDVEEEWAYVLSGRGRVKIGPQSLPVRAGHYAAFPPGPRPHHFVAEGDEPLVILEGGERRPDEDSCHYPELGVRSRKGVDEPLDRSTLPPFEGDARQLVHIDDLEEERRPHPLTAAAIRYQRHTDASAGAERQACCWVRIEPGIESTTFHTHDRTDEWVYLLSGEVELRLGADRYRVHAGEFVAHPAGSPPHVMRAISETPYLMGGQADPDDVVTYPDLGMQKTREGFAKIAG